MLPDHRDMDKQRNPDKQTAARFGRAVRDFAGSEVGGRAKWMFAALIVLLFGINGMNVIRLPSDGCPRSPAGRT
jgi:hypothetical protein